MKSILLCAGASVMLASCAQCPDTSDYDKVPYKGTRTAGLGTAVYDSNCPVPEQPAQALLQTPAPAPVLAPAPVPAREEPVFMEKQMK